MAYLKRLRKGGEEYLYIVQSVRKGKKVTPKILEYLGNAAKVDPVKLKRALAYWKVKPKAKPRKGKGRKGR